MLMNLNAYLLRSGNIAIVLVCLQGRGSTTTDSPSTPGRKKGAGRGRKKAVHSFEPTPGDPDKPFACEREFLFLN